MNASINDLSSLPTKKNINYNVTKKTIKITLVNKNKFTMIKFNKEKIHVCVSIFGGLALIYP